ncbi:LytR/AlgR family response regulator transcription factor [Flavisolibacter ginsenosidimutans]|uniref:Response regulator transcription factor n=1 Tax=Flavisolibacter ginsenosidimutans TaxID=661481 RepID=A0A5B8ULX9_9BACT|nr:LytTR family DNA-binding domain-containing protein [Flavisolibacter ginsenosidimutans]QEC57342.1 response regulator transcription factor [Flavisolibacter ginsenosidimutans]
MKLNCFVVDDEPLARKGLKEYIGDVDFLQFAGEADSPLKATEQVSSGNVHLLFLDIQMPKITGLQFFSSLQQAPPVIFTTAYPQYALDGFELNALDYLVKPISFDRFLKAALRAKEYYDVRTQNQQQDSAANYLFIKVDGKLVKIFYDDILYVEALQNYVTVHTKEKKYITYLTFHSIEEFLPQNLFIKAHKSYLVAISKIESIEGACICIGQHALPISRNLKDQVMEKLVNNRLLKR